MTQGVVLVEASVRLPGLYLTRLVAVIGMVLVHARSDLAADGAGVAASWLELVQAVATNRARLLFFLLAGVGVALLVRHRDVGAGVLLRRAAFLTVLGVALALGGWSDLTLVFYGVLFVCAVLLVRLSDRLLLVAAVVVAVRGVLRLALDPAADDTLTNVLLVVGEMVSLFCLGLMIGRRDLADRAVVRVVAGMGALLAVPGLIVLAVVGGLGALDVAEVEGPFSRNEAGRWSPLVVAGGMPLSAYVGHALLFPLLARVTDWRLGVATAVAVAYLVGMVLAATAWRRHSRSGPVEALMRRASGPREVAPNGIRQPRSRPRWPAFAGCASQLPHVMGNGFRRDTRASMAGPCPVAPPPCRAKLLGWANKGRGQSGRFDASHKRTNSPLDPDVASRLQPLSRCAPSGLVERRPRHG